jgi:hypothetical protein
MKHLLLRLALASSLLLGIGTTAAAAPAVMDTPQARFSLSPDTGQFELLDKRAGVTWRSNPLLPRFGEITVRAEGKAQTLSLAACELERNADRFHAVFHPLPAHPEASVRVTVRLVSPAAFEFTFAADPALRVESARLLDHALWTTDAARGAVIVPVREGLLIPADSRLAFTNRFGTFDYEGCHMEMFAAQRDGAVALVTWHDPYVTLELKSALSDAPWVNGHQALLPSLSLRRSATSFVIHLLGQGDYVQAAHAYRQVARHKGWLIPWDEKLKGHPERTNYFGASNVKLWSTLSREMNEDSSAEVSVRVNWTFDEAAQIAEHLKHDLQLDKVLFILGGWIHRGYDNQHPDILPTAPECGGDAAFTAACRRIRAQGYLLSLHDNYQDIYRDSPSWNENLVSKNADGKLTVGGKWAGGRAYITCSQKALELAKRPQNLLAVKQLSQADSYFIDTTYAVGLSECSDKNHPLTKWDDMHWKQALSDYARGVFGSFGSECGREWAIPHSDFFEGFTGVSGTYFHNQDLPRQLGAAVVPLFELVYRDCIAMYGKYGYNPAQAAEYVLHHIAIGRPLNYHSVPPHLYWQNPPASSVTPYQPGDPALFCRADAGWAEELHPMDRFLKNTHEILSPLNELTARLPMTSHSFLTPDRKVQWSHFGNTSTSLDALVNLGHSEYPHRSPLGDTIVLPPGGFVVESDSFIAFHARSWAGLKYELPPLFTLRSLDGLPLRTSHKVRVFHAFGDPRLQLGTNLFTVRKEAVIQP